MPDEADHMVEFARRKKSENRVRGEQRTAAFFPAIPMVKILSHPAIEAGLRGITKSLWQVDWRRSIRWV
jgi:hypothetical protein